jgi:riboflavin synthase
MRGPEVFTGIVEEVGVIERSRPVGGDLRLRVGARLVTQDLRVGDSVAVSGCCLTAVEVDTDGFEVELSKETMAKTAARWGEGDRVNLERALAVGDRLGGHIVSGHVEGTGTVLAKQAEPGAFVLTLRAPGSMARYLIPKGSITVDGVSLTIVDVGGPAGSSPALGEADFTLTLIPHTLDATTLAALAPGSVVNLETDTLARYTERLLAFADGALRADAGGGPVFDEEV